jgi:23S rRNA pseudouridine1911/1915/1917 synthase
MGFLNQNNGTFTTQKSDMNISPKILYQDSEILVINKPFGMSSQDDLTGTESVLSFFQQTHAISRLDKRVGGLMILAKNAESAKKYSDWLQTGKLKKVYHCVVASKPEKDEAILTHWLKKEAKAKVFEKETHDAKKAVLSYKVLQSSERYHLLEVKIETGRFHQIRAQLAAIGSPIVGDMKYGFKRNSSDGSIFLCCTQIQIGDVLVKIPIPQAWKRYGLG